MEPSHFCEYKVRLKSDPAYMLDRKLSPPLSIRNIAYFATSHTVRQASKHRS